MQVRYLDGFKFQVEQRGHVLVTDQPRPVSGDEGMTPVELMGAALGGCVAVYAADFLTRNEIPREGLVVEVEWQSATQPNRVGAYNVVVRVPHALTERQNASLSRLVHACTVHNTFSHPPRIDIALTTPISDPQPGDSMPTR
ncbi:MAG: OsmC family protein [Deltaproteobacteria bacterium]|nr:OsmC family protein [Deltaproteobacteria bacterium]